MSAYPHARFMLSVDSLSQLPAEGGAEVAFIGRSNAGKSSALNAITQRRNLARKGKTPGQTQLVNFFELSPERRLVDLPGYGYAKVPVALQSHWQALVGDYLQRRESLAGLFLIVDARRGIRDDDRMLLEWAWRRELPTRVLLSKCDKLTRNEGRQILRQTQTAFDALGSAQLFSGVTLEGVEAAREALDAMLDRGQKNALVDRGAEPPGQTNPVWG